MRNGDVVGYEMWKMTVYPKNKGLVQIVVADVLNSLISKHVFLNFAITINQQFENYFTNVVKDICNYIQDNYGEDGFPEIPEDQKRYEDEAYNEVKSVESFIGWLNNRLKISVELIAGNEEKQQPYYYLTLTFPNEDSRQLMASRFKGNKNFTAGPFRGKPCPLMDEKNPAMLKFYVIEKDNTLSLTFPDPEMSPSLFISLPELERLLGIESREENIIKTPPKQIEMITCPDYLLGYTQLLLVPQFPKVMNPGALYLEIKGFYDTLTLSSKSLDPKILNDTECKQFRKALSTDKIELNFDQFKLPDFQLDIFQNAYAFTLLKEFSGSPSAFTVRKRLKPIRTFDGHHLVRNGESYFALEGAIQRQEYQRLALRSKKALKSMSNEIKRLTELELSIEQIKEDKVTVEGEIKSLPIPKLKPRIKTTTDSGCFCLFGNFFSSRQTYDVVSEQKDEKTQADIAKLEQRKIELDSRKARITAKLESLSKEHAEQEQHVNNTKQLYTLFRKQQMNLASQYQSSDYPDPPSSRSSESISSNISLSS